ncbi:hypothetical protein HID58_028851 [Brassica napus]|uniref:Uncharacterized protein n=1 Tax=Brassica napus TaxID=3708 RepID=A0ABQ8CBC8_BRANA|nr:hypothetical protein HID58_028851 [Brassica napus]
MQGILKLKLMISFYVYMVIQHKTKHGEHALARLKSGHKYYLLGRLSSELKRRERLQVMYERKKQLNKLRDNVDQVVTY